MKTESNKAMPTAMRADTPQATKSGMTSTGPPAPEREQTAPVVTPKKSRKNT